MKRITALLLTFALIAVCLCSCGTVKEKTAVNVALLKGPTGMGGVYLMEQNDIGKTENKYNFSIETSADMILSLLSTNKADIAAVPTNYACIIQAKGSADIKVIAVNTLGVLYVLEKGTEINSVSDLSGKKIVTSGQGTAADAVLSALVGNYGATPEVTYVSEHSEALAQAIAGNFDAVVLPEPFVSNLLSKNAGFRVALNLTEEWTDAGFGDLPMGALVARTEFINENPEAVDAFLSEYAASVDYINKNAEDGAALVEKYGIMAAAVAKNAIPNCNMVCVTGNEMKTSLNAFYSRLFSFKPQLIGGSMPSDGIFYKAD